MKQKVKQVLKQSFHTRGTMLRFASNEALTNNIEGEKMDEEELVLELGYLLIKLRIP